MKNLKSLILSSIIAIGSVSALSSCKDKNKNPNDNEPVEETIDIKTIKDGMTVLNTKTNYSFAITCKRSTSTITLPSMKFTKNFVGKDGRNRSDTDLIVKDKEGLYHLGYDTNFVSGEYLVDEEGNKYTSLFDNKVVKTMYGVETDYVNSLTDSNDDLNITSKKYRLAFIQSVGFESTDYSYISSLVASFANRRVIFTLTLTNSAVYSYKLTDHGTTKSDNYNAYLEKGGKPFTPSAELSEFRRLLKTNNYMQNLFYFYDDETDQGGDEYGFYAMRYCFAPHYWYQYSLSDSSNMAGYIEITNSSKSLKGVYGFSVVNNSIDSVNTTNAYFTRPDVVTFMHYPSLLKLLSSLEYIKSGELSGCREEFPGSNKYYFDNSTLIADFQKNFSLDQSSFVDFECVGIGLEINLNYANPDNNNKVESVMAFHYLMNVDSMVVDYPFPFFGFGRAEMKAFNDLYDYLATM